MRNASRAEVEARLLGVPRHGPLRPQTTGLDEVRKVPGYHDEPLKGDRIGQRSIRLSRAYGAIYEIKGDTTRFVTIEEVSKHDY